MTNLNNYVLLIVLFFGAAPAWATTALVIDSNSLTSYDIESALLTSDTVSQCTNWTYDSTRGFDPPDPSDPNYYESLSYTVMTATITPSGASAPVTISFQPACDGSNQAAGVYNSDLYSLSQIFADMKTGTNPTQACTRFVSCEAGGLGPCQTVSGTQTGSLRVIVQVDSNNKVIDSQQGTVWGPCQ